jgi:hypothetical protein
MGDDPPTPPEPTDPEPDDGWGQLKDRLSGLIDERLEAHHQRTQATTKPADPPKPDPAPPAPAPKPAKPEGDGDRTPQPVGPSRARRWFGLN